MAPPPAYHTVIDPVPAQNMRNSYDPEDEKDDDETPEINVNASTQIRGHGNIISIAQMDSGKIASLVAMLLYGSAAPPTTTQPPTSTPQQQPSSPENSQIPSPRLTPQPPSERPHRSKKMPKMIINVICGASVVGDRNIVGPGLGDIARHMQIAQRNQALAQQQNQMNANRAAAAAAPAGANAPGATIPPPGLGFPIHAQPTVTPPMSRSSSLGSEGAGGGKRKYEGPCEGHAAKKSCSVRRAHSEA